MPAPLPPAVLIAEARRRKESGGIPFAPPSFRLYPKTKQFHEVVALECLIGGAAGGSKTSCLLSDALRFVNNPNYSALILRRTYAALQLRGSIMDRAIEWLGRGFWKDKDKVFRFPSGATIQFGYVDSDGDLDRYKSAEFTRIYIDELTEWGESWYTFLFSRIRRIKGVDLPLAMRAGTNPDGVGAEWVRQRFGIPEGQIIEAPIVTCNGDRVFLPARAEDNPALDLVAYERSLAQLGPAKFQQLRWGRWVRDGEGLVYKFSPSLNLHEGPVPKLTHYMLGVDYGVVDECAFTIAGWRENDPTLYILQSYRKPDCDPTGAALEVQSLMQNWDFERIVGDEGGQGKAFAAEARNRFQIPIEAAQKTNKRGYISLMNGALQSGAVKVIPNGPCDDLIGEWKVLPWNVGRQKEAEGFKNHASDSCLYVWRCAPNFLAQSQAARAPIGSPERALAETENFWKKEDEKWEAQRATAQRREKEDQREARWFGAESVIRSGRSAWDDEF